MKIKLKTLDELKKIATGGDDSKTIEDQTLFLLEEIADKEYQADDLDVAIAGSDKKYTFIINTLNPVKRLYTIRIPEVWCKDYDLEEYGDNYLCKRCSFTPAPNTTYQLEKGRIYDEATKKWRRLTWKEAIEEKKIDPVICPVCFGSNCFTTVK